MPIGMSPSTSLQLQPKWAAGIEQVAAVLVSGDTQGRGQPRGTTGEVPIAARRCPAAAGSRDPDDDLPAPDQGPARRVLGMGHHIQAPVHPVGEVHVGVAHRTEQRGVAFGPAAVGMGRGVGPRACVGLHLRDADGDPRPQIADQQCAQKQRGDLGCGAAQQVPGRQLRGTPRITSSWRHRAAPSDQVAVLRRTNEGLRPASAASTRCRSLSPG